MADKTLLIKYNRGFNDNVFVMLICIDEGGRGRILFKALIDYLDKMCLFNPVFYTTLCCLSIFLKTFVIGLC